MAQPIEAVLTQWPAWWEFMIQWGGLFLQAAAAAATVGAVVVALRISQRDAQWRHEAEEREASIATQIVNTEIQHVGAVIKRFMDEVEALRRDWPVTAEDRASVANTYRQLMLRFELPRTWMLIDKLGFLKHGKRIARVLASLPSLEKSSLMIINMLETNRRSEEQFFNAKGAAEILYWFHLKILEREDEAATYPYSD